MRWFGSRSSPPRLNLALQGGGAHGAFTWGVLEGLLEDPRVRFDGLSGSSAGAMRTCAAAQIAARRVPRLNIGTAASIPEETLSSLAHGDVVENAAAPDIVAAAVAGALLAAADGAVDGHAGQRWPASAREPVIAPDRGDRRFSAEEWRDNPWYSLLKQTYLLNARLLDDMVEASDLDAKAEAQAALLRAPVHRLDEPGQFRGDQSRCDQARPRNQWRKRQGRPRQPARRT